MSHPNPDNRSQAEKNADPNYNQNNQTDAQKAENARLKKIQDDKDNNR